MTSAKEFEPDKQIYNDLKLLNYYDQVSSAKGNKRARWKCLCLRCNRKVILILGNVTSGRTKSCGCRRASKGGLTSKFPDEYQVFTDMHKRCSNETNVHYGAKGITVCKRWSHTAKGFAHFLKDMQAKPSSEYTLDRINNSAGYRPSNCRWVTQKSQQNNRTNNRWLIFRGKRQTLSLWAAEIGISPACLKKRLDSYGWTLTRALTTKTDGRKRP